MFVGSTHPAPPSTCPTVVWVVITWYLSGCVGVYVWFYGNDGCGCVICLLQAMPFSDANGCDF